MGDASSAVQAAPWLLATDGTTPHPGRQARLRCRSRSAARPARGRRRSAAPSRREDARPTARPATRPRASASQIGGSASAGCAGPAPRIRIAHAAAPLAGAPCARRWPRSVPRWPGRSRPRRHRLHHMRARGTRGADAVLVVLEDEAFLRGETEPARSPRGTSPGRVWPRHVLVGQHDVEIAREACPLHHQLDRGADRVRGHREPVSRRLAAWTARIRARSSVGNARGPAPSCSAASCR